MGMRRLSLVSALLVAFVLPASAQASGHCAGQHVAPAAGNAAAVRSATLCLLNDERADRGMGRLTTVPALRTVAGAYAHRMVREGFFDHSSPDGGTFVTRIKGTSYLRGGVKRWSVGENIAWGSGSRATPRAIVTSWMQSPGHRRNILNPRFNELGLGVALGAPSGARMADAATYVNEFGLRHR